MSPFARDLMENSKRDDCMIVGSDVRALCMEILKLEKERDDPLEQARRKLPVFSALRAEVAALKTFLSLERESAKRDREEMTESALDMAAQRDRERERREAAEAITNDWQAALKQESAAHNATKGALEAALAEIAEAHKALPNNIPFKNGTLAGRIGFVLARDEANARAEVAALKALLREALDCEGAEGFNSGFADRCRAAGVEAT